MLRTWDSYREVFMKIIDTYKPQSYLEWGGGDNSTALALEYIPTCYTVEHNKEWFDKIPGSNKHLLTLLECVHCDYTLFPHQIAEPLDMIFVDGRNRYLCCDTAKKVINPKGIVMIHDTDREKYWDGVNLFPYIKDYKELRTTVCSLSPILID